MSSSKRLGLGPLALVLLAAACSESTGPDPEPRPQPFALEQVGFGFSQDRFTSDLWVHGGYAYTGSIGCMSVPVAGGGTTQACGDRLTVWDVRDPASPAIVDSVIVEARTVNDVKVSPDGTLAVLTHELSPDGQNGITILDLADPAHPTVITRYTEGLEPGVHNVWFDGRYVYAVVDGTGGGIRILDVEDPAEPREVAHYYGGASFVHDVYVRDGLAFVSHWDAGLVILDVGAGLRGGSPENPVEVSRVAIDNTHNAWYWPERGLVFVGEEDFGVPGGVHVVDATDLAAPAVVATYHVDDPSVTPHNVWLDEDRGVLYVGWYEAGLRAIDVTGELAGRLETQDRELARATPVGPRGAARVWAPQLVDDLIFVSDINHGLFVFRRQ